MITQFFKAFNIFVLIQSILIKVTAQENTVFIIQENTVFTFSVTYAKKS